jgi:hypothetical protein
MAAKRGQAYLDLPEANQDAVARNVTFNLYQRSVCGNRHEESATIPLFRLSDVQKANDFHRSR